MGEETVMVTRDQIAEALAQWEADATRENWPQRHDAERHSDTADYLFAVLADKG